MGSFRDIVRSQRGRSGRIDEFTLGFSIPFDRRGRVAPLIVRVTFSEEGSQPIVSSVHYNFGKDSFSLHRGINHQETIFKTSKFEATIDFALDENWIYWLDYLGSGRGEHAEASRDAKRVIKYLTEILSSYKKSARRIRFFLWTEGLPSLLPVAPLRSKPKRTYDPIRETASPEGEHIPMLMMRLDRTDKSRWNELHDNLVTFGKASGLFSDIAVRRHGRQMSDPFQLQVKVRAGSRANIMDVGYGVSQSLPILVDVRSHEQSIFLLQQPEVHLHPRAQAELASLFVESYKKGHNHFIIETHSDYIIDRIRILAKKKEINPDDVSILYFAPQGNAVEIHSISLDDRGNLQGSPEGYRDFFIRESDRLLGFEN